MYATLTQRLTEIARDAADNVAILHRHDDAVHAYTYGRVYQDSLKIAHWLVAMGLRPGDRVAILLENRPEWVLSYFGLLFAGGVAVPIDAQSRPELIRFILEQTAARVIFASVQAPLSAFQEEAGLEKIVVIGEEPPSGEKIRKFSDILTDSVNGAPLPRMEPEDLASIIYTSGTTGQPKGVMLTHRNFDANFQGIAHLQAVTPTDNFLSILPLHHAFPFMATLIVPLFSGARVTFINTLKAEPILRCMREQQVTGLVATPQVLQHFYQGISRRFAEMPGGLGTLLMSWLALSQRVARYIGVHPGAPLLKRIKAALGPQFRFFISGGAKLPEDLYQNLGKLGFVVLEGYGLTETAPVATFNPPEAPRIGAAGKPLAGVAVRILNPDAQGVGEILIRGDNVMQGYYRNEAATREVIRDGWLQSGDQGFLDRDGYLFIRGRLKDIIVLSSGKNISAEEVGQHYLQSAKIKEICVLPDDREEKLVAVVVPDLEHFRASGETDIYGEVKWQMEYYSQQLEPYKRVRDFVLINQELPKTRLGKIKRFEAAAIYRQQAGGRDERKKSALEEDLSATGEDIVRLLMEKTGYDPIALDDHLELDLGLDSLALVELIAALEQRCQIRIREGEFAGIFTVAELIRVIEEKHPEDAGEPEVEARSWQEILQTDPSPPLLARIDLAPGMVSRLFTRVCSLVFDAVCSWCFRLQVDGRDRLGEAGCVLCPNHASFLDGFLLFSAVPPALRLRLFFMGYSTYFEVPVVRHIVKLMRVIPVNSARYLVEAMQASAYVLRRGSMMGIFPEGARSVSGELRKFKKGVAILAQELGVKIVPVYIHGSYEAWGPNARFPRRHPIRVVFGRDCTAAALREAGLKINPDASPHEAITMGLQEAVAGLKKEVEELLKTAFYESMAHPKA